jgi:ribose transport system substrate-binding protein
MRTFQLSLLAATLMLATGLAHAAGGEIAVIVKTSSSNYWQNVQKGANASRDQPPKRLLPMKSTWSRTR